jgi:hypothetical protein
MNPAYDFAMFVVTRSQYILTGYPSFFSKSP